MTQIFGDFAGFVQLGCVTVCCIYIYIDREYRYDDTYLIYIYILNIYIIYIGELH